MLTKRLFLCLFFLCYIPYGIAQETVSIYLTDENDRPIPFYTLENVKFKKDRYIADSLGKISIPFIKGMAYSIHAIGYNDTITTIHEPNSLKLRLKSKNLLKEVIITAPKFTPTSFEIKASRANQVNWWANGAGQNVEIGRIINFEKEICLQKVKFKLKSKYILNFKDDVYFSIYKTNEKLESDLDALKKKKNREL